MTRGGILLGTDNSDNLYKLVLAHVAGEPSLSYGLALEDLKAVEDTRYVSAVLVEAALLSSALRLYLAGDGFPGDGRASLLRSLCARTTLRSVGIRLEACRPLLPSIAGSEVGDGSESDATPEADPRGSA